MTGKETNEPALRDGKETLPECLDLPCDLPAIRSRIEQDDLLTEALEETFPASDPVATGRFE